MSVSSDNLYNSEYFARFLLKLIAFRYWLLRYKENYSEINDDELIIIILNLFPVEELSYLSYEFKILALDLILVKQGWRRFFAMPTLNLEEKDAVVKIIRSIYHEVGGIPNYQEINKFLKYLADVNINVSSEAETYYQVLYDKVKDPLLFGDDGKGYRGQFVKAVYNLWMESEYNMAHEDPVIANNALTKFQYTPYRADKNYEQTNQFDELAAPLLLSYETERIYLWYKDNFDFKFYDRKIAVLDTETRNENYVGFYHIYQPVAIKATDHEDTIIKMPIHGISDVDSPNNVQYINNCIPIFYLKYVDDLGDFSDAKQTIGTAANVALFFTGIGSLANLRYLRHFSLLRNIGAGLSTTEQVLLWNAVGGLTSLAEVLSSAASLIYQIATGSCDIYYDNDAPPNQGTPEYEEYTFCQDVNKWLFALEMVSLSADALTRRALKRASQRMLISMPSDVAASLPSAERQLLNDLAGIAEELNQFFDDIAQYSNFHNRIASLRISSEKQAYEFAYGYKGNRNAWQRFDADVTLIDEWEELIHSAIEKRNINFLINYRFIKNNALMNHAMYGDVKITREILPDGTLGNTSVELTGMHNPHQMVTPPPYVEGKWHFKNNDYIENSMGYRLGKIERTMTVNDIDPRTNIRWENPFEPPNRKFIKVKKDRTGVWPIDYTPQQIKEEMTKAFTNKVTDVSKQANTLRFYGRASDGMKITIFKDKFGKWSIYPDNSYITINH